MTKHRCYNEVFIISVIPQGVFNYGNRYQDNFCNFGWVLR
jgi:hypothetical protein